MFVPNADDAVVAPEKVARDLLVPVVHHRLSTGGKERAMTERIDECDGVTLRAAIPSAAIAISHLPTGEGLIPDDAGAVVDAMQRDDGWVTVEFFRDGKTVAVADVPLARLRLAWKAPTALPSQRR